MSFRTAWLSKTWINNFPPFSNIINQQSWKKYSKIDQSKPQDCNPSAFETCWNRFYAYERYLRWPFLQIHL